MKLEETFNVDNECPLIVPSIDGSTLVIDVLHHDGLVYQSRMPVGSLHNLYHAKGHYEEWLKLSRRYLEARRSAVTSARTVAQLERSDSAVRAVEAVNKVLDSPRS